MPFSAIKEAIRKEMAEAHNPPLYSASETAEILERSLHTVGQLANKFGWAVYHLPGPFHKANYYAQADIDSAKAILEANDGRWPTAGSGNAGPSTRELHKQAEARDAARLADNRLDFVQRCPSFAEFSQDEQEAFVADVVDKDNAMPRQLGPKFDRSEFVAATRRWVAPAQQAKVMNCVDLYYGAGVNFGHLRPTITVRVIAELIATAPRPTTKRR